MADDPNKDEAKQSPYVASWVRQYALVFEFLASLGLFGYVGYRLDQRYGWQPWGLLVGLLLGMAVGLYLMIRGANRRGDNSV